jgi:hypothetical protein
VAAAGAGRVARSTRRIVSGRRRELAVSAAAPAACAPERSGSAMELPAVGEHVFAVESIEKKRIRKVGVARGWRRRGAGAAAGAASERRGGGGEAAGRSRGSRGS